MVLSSMEERLPTELWVMAHLRAANVQGVTMTVVHRGDPSRGTVLLKINRLDRSFRVLSQVRQDNRLAWLRATGPDPVEEPVADGYIERQLRFDSDLWVIEVEDRLDRPWFEGKIIG